MDQLIGWLIMGGAVTVLVGVLWWKPKQKPRLTIPQRVVRLLYWSGARLMAHARAYDEYLMIYRRHRQFLLWLPQNEAQGNEAKPDPPTPLTELYRPAATERTYKPLEDTRS